MQIEIDPEDLKLDEEALWVKGEKAEKLLNLLKVSKDARSKQLHELYQKMFGHKEI